MTQIPADVTIPALMTGVALGGTELFEAVQTASGIGNSVKLTANQLAAFVGTTVIPLLPPQTANTFLAGPTSGAASTPAFRALVLGDLPLPSSAGQVLIGQNATTIAWESISQDLALSALGTATVTGLQGRPLLPTLPTTSQVLTWNGSAWLPTSLGASGITSIIAGTGLTGGTITGTGTISLTVPVLVSLGGTGTTTMVPSGIVLSGANATAQFSSTTVLPVPKGGIGTVTVSPNAVVLGGTNATAPLQTVTGTAALFLQSQGTASLPAYTTALTNVATGWGLTGGPISTTGTASIATVNPPYGFEAPVNLGLAASVLTGVLTVAFKGNNGSDPSATNPVLVGFRSTNLTTGTPTWVPITSALSISTFTVGATLGATNAIPFRLWVLLFFQNATTVMPALINCSNASAVFQLPENTLQTTVAISATATSAGVYYTPNGTTVSASPFRIVGYVEYGSGLTAAGTYSTAPTTIQLFGPGIKKPGEVVQIKQQTFSAGSSTSGTTYINTVTTLTIVPSAAPNLIKYVVTGNAQNATASQGAITSMFRGTISGTQIGVATFAASVAGGSTPLAMIGYDLPSTTTVQTYTVGLKSQVTGNTVNFAVGIDTNLSNMILEEIMG